MPLDKNCRGYGPLLQLVGRGGDCVSRRRRADVRRRPDGNRRGGEGDISVAACHESKIPWKNIAAMRDQLAHRYFDTEHAFFADNPRLLEDVDRLRSRLTR